MFDTGDKVEYEGETVTAVQFFEQPCVVLERADGSRFSAPMLKVMHNLMTKLRAPSKEPKA